MSPSLFLTLSAALLFPFLLGHCLIALAGPRERLPAAFHASLSFGVGAGILTILLFVSGLCGMPFSRGWFIGLPGGLILLCGIILGMKRLTVPDQSRPATPPLKTSSTLFSQDQFFPNILAVILLLFIIGQTLLVFLKAFVVPLYTWDAVSVVAYKAKYFFYLRSLKDLAVLPHAYYPLHAPLLETWTAVLIGRWDDILVKLFFPMYFLSFLIMLSAFLSETTNRFWAMAGVGLMLLSPFFSHHATIGYRDFIITYYNCGTVFLLTLWARQRSILLLRLAALFSTLTLWSKLEGNAYALIHLSCLGLIVWKDRQAKVTRKFRTLLSFAFYPVALGMIFFLGKKYLGITAFADRFQWELTLHNFWERLGATAQAFFLTFFITGNWNLIWPLAGMSLFQFPRIAGRRLFVLILLVGVLAHLSMYFLISVTTVSFYWLGGKGWWVGLPRAVLHIYPLAVALVVLLNAPPEENASNTSPA